MPILNYTTTIAVEKTIGEIMVTLSKAGAHRILVDYDDQGRPEAISFQLTALDVNGGNFTYRLPAHWLNVRSHLAVDKAVAARYTTPEHAQRVAWRIIKDWIEAQIALIQSGQSSMTEIMLPYLITGPNRTLYTEWKERFGNLLPPPSEQ